MDLLAQLGLVKQQAQDNFSFLSADQLNWKPSTDKWSIGQCLDHLIVSDTSYFSTFDKMLAGTYKPSLGVRINPLKKFFGRMGIKTLGPQPTKKFKNPKLFEPAASSIPSSIVQKFSQHQETMKSYFRKLLELKAGKIYMASPVTPVISYSLADALAILAGHEQRHINQALQVMHHPNFPK